MDEYLTGVREIEQRIAKSQPTIEFGQGKMVQPRGVPGDYGQHLRLMADLLALAFEGDITRSATFMLGRDLSGSSFPESGFNGGWHGSSHHGDKPENVATDFLSQRSIPFRFTGRAFLVYPGSGVEVQVSVHGSSSRGSVPTR